MIIASIASQIRAIGQRTETKASPNWGKTVNVVFY